ncbi:unnamed protein product [Dovyalis caffra]|uniref:Uncharacterized protein n=1 Tax=Dovyalis caffra TaxID=77055 RepID=A0AAV1SJG2_9ROSI|nr:unnamed protein product [Dovyalis caffra]
MQWGRAKERVMSSRDNWQRCGDDSYDLHQIHAASSFSCKSKTKKGNTEEALWKMLYRKSQREA